MLGYPEDNEAFGMWNRIKRWIRCSKTSRQRCRTGSECGGTKLPRPPLPEHHRRMANRSLESILSRRPGGNFLEVGLGDVFRPRRAQVIADNNIKYVGLDFEQVCASHRAQSDEKGPSGFAAEYRGNSAGTYLYNLIRLRREGWRFDVIYLDGHHTLYVDFPAAIACVPLLKDNGYLVFDDVEWRMKDKEENLSQSEFYSGVYDFGAYTEEEKNEPHIRIIVEEYMLPLFDFVIDSEFTMPNWAVLRRS